MLRLSEACRPARPRLVTASAGNHGRALAHAAAACRPAADGLCAGAAPAAARSTRSAPPAPTLDSRRDYDEAERRAKAHGGRPRDVHLTVLTPGRDCRRRHGRRSRSWSRIPDVDAIVVAIGGGGLISGVAIATAGRATDLGVEAAASCPFTQGLAAGRIVADRRRPHARRRPRRQPRSRHHHVRHRPGQLSPASPRSPKPQIAEAIAGLVARRASDRGRRRRQPRSRACCQRQRQRQGRPHRRSCCPARTSTRRPSAESSRFSQHLAPITLGAPAPGT